MHDLSQMTTKGAQYLFHRLMVRITRQLRANPLLCRLSKPIASFTFDDFPKSAWVNGGPILAAYSAPATYYVAGSFCGQTLDGVEYYDRSDLLSVHSAGHEIGDHTFAHEAAPSLPSERIRDDSNRNSHFIGEVLGGVRPETFAYPYGAASLRTKRIFSELFRCCRGSEEGLNSGWLDLAQLSVVSLRRDRDLRIVRQSIAAALRLQAWIIFVTHDVDCTPSPWGTTPRILYETLAETRAAGIEILTVKDALAHVISATAIGTDPDALSTSIVRQVQRIWIRESSECASTL